jgi:hypothetical protein
MVRGPIEATEVPLTGTVDGEVLVAVFDGPLQCAQRSGSSLTGVVGSREIFTSQSVHRRWRRAGDHVTVLNVGASPRAALILLVALAAVGVLGVGFAGYYLAAMFRSGDRHSAPLPTKAPIEAR